MLTVNNGDVAVAAADREFMPFGKRSPAVYDFEGAEVIDDKSRCQLESMIAVFEKLLAFWQT